MNLTASLQSRWPDDLPFYKRGNGTLVKLRYLPKSSESGSGRFHLGYYSLP